MFLKSLTLKGFKSFAETTTLEFEPGVTVVVGPNGSGKSNIVDAVAWVLGAQGPRTVRSSKMEDVIFAGSAKRPALGRAEVSLTIDNSAGLLPIDFTEVTLTRTLFRSSGESEYAINGVPCRLLDVQELLSDSGVGRQQHVIVSQGQLDSVLNARPEDRRLIIEEAAGILKYRRRKERAERRLEATEGNLLRLQDLLREVRRQLRPLERQADAARRHDDLAGELHALRVHLAGREIVALRGRMATAARAITEQREADGALRAELARLDSEVMQAEARLTATDTSGLADALARFEALRERARGLVALLAERVRSAERGRAASIDESLVSSLEAETAEVARELAAVDADDAALAPGAEALVAEESQVSREVLTSAAEARGELAARRTALARERDEAARLERRLADLAERAASMNAEADRLRADVADADRAERPLAAAHAAAEDAHAQAAARVADREAALARAIADRQAWTARAEALALALDEARARAGAERLAGVDGVLGTLLELVEVDPGWEAAFEAAVGDALAAVVVDDADAARRAIAHLKASDVRGAVLARGRSRPPASLPLLGEPIRGHVRGLHAAVDALLDELLQAAVVVSGGWEQALDVAMAHPGAIAVTEAGDRFAGGSAHLGAAGAGATGAALDEARLMVDEAATAIAAGEHELHASRAELDGAASALVSAVGALDANDARLSAATDALQRVERARHDVLTESDMMRSRLDEIAARIEREAARVAELEASVPALQAGADQAARLATRRAELELRAAALEERRALLLRRRRELEDRLARHAAERDEAAARRVELETLVARTARLAALVDDRLALVETGLAALRERRRAQTEAARAAAEGLDALRRARVSAERRLEEVRELARRAELDEAEARMRLEAAVDLVRRELACEPDTAVDAPCPDLPPGTSPANRVRELERELRLLGPVNPLALEEFTALQERATFLEGQLDDVKATRRDLAKVIRAIDAEIVQVFGAAFADVADNFAKLFETLFPGGHGGLRLTDPDNPLETGIEVEARPLGKNVRKLSLLSGGERSLTALAFLFAVFRSRPSPFYLLDEVEAALDDVNLHRFLDLIHEFREEAQLLVVSHQKRTMEAADSLYGVTMQPGGSSKVISERVTAPTQL